jgi:hypothetical protein
MPVILLLHQSTRRVLFQYSTLPAQLDWHLREARDIRKNTKKVMMDKRGFYLLWQVSNIEEGRFVSNESYIAVGRSRSTYTFLLGVRYWYLMTCPRNPSISGNTNVCGGRLVIISMSGQSYIISKEKELRSLCTRDSLWVTINYSAQCY